MISATDRGQIFNPANRGFLLIDHSEAHVDREKRNYQWLAPATNAHRWARIDLERFLTELVPAGSQTLKEQFAGCIVIQAPICACCGDVEFRDLTCVAPNRDPELREYRCETHRDRNPCVVEGCRRTRAASGNHSSRATVCGEHWRRYVPPGSAERRALQRMVRLAKKRGHAKTEIWPDELEDRYWRVWFAIVRRVRARSTDGQLDVTEINKLFGWEHAA